MFSYLPKVDLGWSLSCSTIYLFCSLITATWHLWPTCIWLKFGGGTGRWIDSYYLKLIAMAADV
jgi:hypothetical protein